MSNHPSHPDHNDKAEDVGDLKTSPDMKWITYAFFLVLILLFINVVRIYKKESHAEKEKKDLEDAVAKSHASYIKPYQIGSEWVPIAIPHGWDAFTLENGRTYLRCYLLPNGKYSNPEKIGNGVIGTAAGPGCELMLLKTIEDWESFPVDVKFKE
jgi:hypothetical protein